MPLFLLCLACACVRLAFLFLVPMSQAPDEINHHYMVSFISEHGRLPALTDIVAGGPVAVYGSMPALGYIPHVLFSWLAANHALVYERLASVLAGVILVFAGYRVGQELFPNKRILQMALPAVLIFHPQLAFAQAYVNSDVTAAALAGLVLWLTLRTIRLGVDLKLVVCMGLLLGWLVLSKYSGLALVPAVVGGVVAAGIAGGYTLVQCLQPLLLLMGTMLATCGWCFVRNYHEFSGDVLGTQTMYRIWATAYHKPLHYYLPVWQIATNERWWRMMFYSFWGLFGYMDTYMWRPTYYVYEGFVLAAAAGWSKQAISGIRSGETRAAHMPLAPIQPPNTGRGGMYTARFRTVAGWLCLTSIPVLNLLAMLWASTGNLGGPQGRYLFCSELPVVALLIAGLNLIGGKHGTNVVLSFVLFNAAVCLGAWLMLFCTYGLRGGI
jgi:hypothetical protein